MSPEEKSRIRRSPAYSQEPSARVMTTCLMPPCADQATRTWSAVSLATVDASVERFVATAIAPSLDREKERPPGRCPAVVHRARPRLVPAGSDLDGGFLEA